MAEPTFSEFLKSLFHTGHTSMQEYAASEKGTVLEYDNSIKEPEETHYALDMHRTNTATDSDNRIAGADYNEQIWYLYNKGYSQQIPMKTAVVNKLRRIAEDLTKVGMAASTFQVTYEKPSTMILKSRKGKEYIFNDYDSTNMHKFKEWLHGEIKDKEHLGEDALEDILVQIYSETHEGKESFPIKFFNLQS
jgi:hypothetical protein